MGNTVGVRFGRGNNGVIYIKRVSTKDPRFSGRKIEVVASAIGTTLGNQITVPDAVVLCNGCNKNIYPEDGYLIYLGKRELDKDWPYDFYCERCVKEYFPGAKEV